VIIQSEIVCFPSRSDQRTNTKEMGQAIAIGFNVAMMVGPIIGGGVESVSSLDKLKNTLDKLKAENDRVKETIEQINIKEEGIKYTLQQGGSVIVNRFKGKFMASPASIAEAKFI
jgi:hypothetical protein